VDSTDIWFALLILFAALLYSSVGHGGASGYLAAMALAGVAPTVMKPAALTLNILVSGIAAWKFCRAGAFSWSLFWPFAIVSIPFAFLGGAITLPGAYYKPLVGIVLIYAAWYSYRTARESGPVVAAPVGRRLFTGATLGFLSGLTGVGGGIFLSPLLLWCRWADVKRVSGIAASFILVNSIAGLLGTMQAGISLPAALSWWAVAAVAGGLIGAEYGSRRLPNPVIKKLLALVLAIAGVKMMLTV
jgi:uncharacterized membrane protein YfcA